MTLGWSFPVQRLTHMAVIECRWFGYEKIFNLKHFRFISHWVFAISLVSWFQACYNQILLNAVLQICV